MKEAPDFTIVIPTYNSLALLQTALSSVLRQEGVSFDVVITDDSTTDDIAQYVSQLADPRISYYHNQPSLGAVANWNTGLAHATGRYVVLMHHDESMADSCHLLTLREAFHCGADVVVANVEVTVGNTIKKLHFGTVAKRFFIHYPMLLLFANAIGPCACIAFRRDYKQPFDTDLHWLVDTEWYYRMLRHHRTLYLPDLTIRSIHGHEGQISTTIDIKEQARQDIRHIHDRYPHRYLLRLTLILKRLAFRL